MIVTHENNKVIAQDGKELISSDYPLHPGFIINDEIEARGVKKKDVAKSLQLLPGHLSDLLSEKRHVNAKLAIKLESYFNIDASFWLRIQCGYDLFKARQAKQLEA